MVRSNMCGSPKAIEAVIASKKFVRAEDPLRQSQNKDVIQMACPALLSMHPRLNKILNPWRRGRGSAGVGHAHAAGTGESGSISFCALRSAQQATGILAFSDATFSVTSLARAAPGITETTIGCARANCNAAAGSETPCALHTASMPRTLACTSGEALP